MRSRKKIAPAFAVGLVPFLALAQTAAAQTAPPQTISWGDHLPDSTSWTALNTVANVFGDVARGWIPQAQAIALHIFAGLVAIELIWSASKWILQKNDLSDVVGALLVKMIGVMFLYALIVFAPTFIPAVISSFMSIGASFGNVQAYTPSDIAGMGVNLAIQTAGPFMVSPWLMAAPFVPTLLAACSFFIVLAYGLIACTLLMALIESYVVVGAGMVMLGFLGSSWTSNFGERYISYAVHVGVKLMVAYIVIGLGAVALTQQTNDLIQAIQTQAVVPDHPASGSGTSPTTPSQPTAQAQQPPTGYLGQVWNELTLVRSQLNPMNAVISLGALLKITVTSLMFAIVAWNLPSLISSFLTGSANLGAGSLASAALGAGAAAAGAAAGVAGAGPALSSLGGRAASSSTLPLLAELTGLRGREATAGSMDTIARSARTPGTSAAFSTAVNVGEDVAPTPGTGATGSGSPFAANTGVPAQAAPSAQSAPGTPAQNSIGGAPSNPSAAANSGAGGRERGQELEQRIRNAGNRLPGGPDGHGGFSIRINHE